MSYISYDITLWYEIQNNIIYVSYIIILILYYTHCIWPDRDIVISVYDKTKKGLRARCTYIQVRTHDRDQPSSYSSVHILYAYVYNIILCIYTCLPHAQKQINQNARSIDLSGRSASSNLWPSCREEGGEADKGREIIMLWASGISRRKERRVRESNKNNIKPSRRLLYNILDLYTIRYYIMYILLYIIIMYDDNCWRIL